MRQASRPIRGLAWTVAVLLAAAIAAATAGSAAPGGTQTWRAKVDPALLERSEAGPAEFLVYLAQKADLSGARTLRTKEAKGWFVYRRLKATAQASQGPLLAELERQGIRHRPFWIVNAIWGIGGRAAIQAAASRAEVAHVYAVGRARLVRPEAQPPNSDSAARATRRATVEGNLTNVRAPEVWAMGYRGQGVTVASADTGVNWTHPALKSKYRGWNALTGTANHDYNWHDAITVATDCGTGRSTQPCDDFSHGSHTVGTMVGDDGAGNQIGMAPDARWIGCRNMAEGEGTVARYIECMEWLMAPTPIGGGPGTEDPSKAPHVVNNSWGCPPSEGCPSQALKDQLAATRAAGIFYSVSAGNSGPTCSTVEDPLGNYENSFSVGATNHNTDLITDFSSRGPAANDTTAHRKPNVAAPGDLIRSSVLGTGYGVMSGTSMAAPHVAGLVALIISAKPQLAGQVETLEDIIEQSAVDKAAPIPCGGELPLVVPNNTYGWGRIDAVEAVERALAIPTTVRLRSFTATRSLRGVRLTWQTESELGVAGFTLWRGSTRVNAKVIAAKGKVRGATYRYLDRRAARGSNHVYRLELVRADGARERIGLARVRPR